MNREDILHQLHYECESLIRLHQKGLFHSQGYRERKEKMLAYIRANEIDIHRELDPVSVVLYRRYFE